jgi:hypothetical protein
MKMRYVIEIIHSTANDATLTVYYAIRWISELKTTIESNEEMKFDIDTATAMIVTDDHITDEPLSGSDPVTEVVLDLSSGLSSENCESNVPVLQESDDSIHSIHLSQSLICNNASVHRTEILGVKNLSRKSSAAEIQMTVS